MTTDYLSPCSVTGKPCRWFSEEAYDDAGEMVSWDNFCEDCFAWRDWSKDEPTTHDAQ